MPRNWRTWLTWLSRILLADHSECDPYLPHWTEEKAKAYGKLHRRYVGDFGSCWSACGPVRVVRDEAAIWEREQRARRRSARVIGGRFQ